MASNNNQTDSTTSRGFIGKLGDIILLSLLFSLCSIPVITVGASMSAAAAVVHDSKTGTDGHLAKRFFAAFKACFGQSTFLWLLWGTLAFIFAFNTRFWYQVWINSSFSVVFPFVFFCVFCFVFAAAVIVNLFPLIGIHKADKKLEHVKRTLLVCYRKFPATFLIIIIDLVCFVVMLKNPFTIIVFVLIGFGLLAYIYGSIHEHCFDIIAELIYEDGVDGPTKKVTIGSLMEDDKKTKESKRRAYAYVNKADDDEDEEATGDAAVSEDATTTDDAAATDDVAAIDDTSTK